MKGFFRRIFESRNEEARNEWIANALKAIPQGARILDAGAGEQRLKKLCSDLKYVSQDFAAYDGKGDEQGLQTSKFDYGELDIISDITDIPEPDGSFDAILCIEVLEHVPDPIGAVKELSRLLSPGGRLILTAPFCSFTHFSPYHFSTGFSKYWYEEHLTSAGFNIESMEANGDFFSFVSQELTRVPSVSKTYVGRNVNIFEKLLLGLVVILLRRISRRGGTPSAELACFGYHTLAVKEFFVDESK